MFGCSLAAFTLRIWSRLGFSAKDSGFFMSFVGTVTALAQEAPADVKFDCVSVDWTPSVTRTLPQLLFCFTRQCSVWGLEFTWVL